LIEKVMADPNSMVEGKSSVMSTFMVRQGGEIPVIETNLGDYARMFCAETPLALFIMCGW
jgi:hypothetical protein